MKYYANIENGTNKLLGWYSDEIHSEIPTPNIEVSEEVWQEAININANCYENGEFIFKDFRTDIEIEKERVASIKAKAGEIITSRYDIIKQMNILGEGGEAQLEMVAWIKKIRDISNKAEQDGTALADIIWE